MLHGRPLTESEIQALKKDCPFLFEPIKPNTNKGETIYKQDSKGILHRFTIDKTNNTVDECLIIL